MQSIFDAITEWLKGLLVEGIMGNLGGLFTNVNEQVGEIAAQVGTTPAAWNAGVFSMIRQLSETVILPIAGLVLTFVMTYELIQMLIDHNNLHNFDTWIFFKWIFKTFVAVMILSNTFNIVMAVFDVSQQVIQQSAGLIQGSTAVTPDVLNDMQTQLEAMELGPLLGIFLQSFFVQFTMTALQKRPCGVLRLEEAGGGPPHDCHAHHQRSDEQSGFPQLRPWYRYMVLFEAPDG